MPPAKKTAVDMTTPNRNNKILSLFSLIAPFLLLPVVAIVAGHVALKEYSKEGADQTWRPLALAGTIAGYAILFIQINVVLIMGSVFMANTAHHSMYDMGNQYYAYDMPMAQGGAVMEDLQFGQLKSNDGTVTFSDTAAPVAGDAMAPLLAPQ